MQVAGRPGSPALSTWPFAQSTSTAESRYYLNSYTCRFAIIALGRRI